MSRRSSILVALLCLHGRAAASANRGQVAARNGYFANDGRRASSWSLNLQVSSVPEADRYRPTSPARRTTRRSANVALTRRMVEQLRGGGDGRQGGGDGSDDPYYGYPNYQDDSDDDYRRGSGGAGAGGEGGGYYPYGGGDYNNDYGNCNSDRYGGSSRPIDDDRGYDYQNYNDNYYNRRDDDGVGRNRRRGSYYDDDERYRENDYGYNQYENDRGSSSYSRKKPRKSTSSSSGLLRAVPDVIRNGNKKYGMMMVGSGMAITAMGMTLFFNKGLMRLGNLLFVGGVPMVIGPTTTMSYFLNPAKVRATGCVVAGIFLVFIGWPLLGILLELFGLLNLFGNMFPLAMYFLRSLPGIGNLFPKNNNARGRQKSKRRDYDDDYYREDRDYEYGDDDGYGDGGAAGGGGGGGYY